MTWQNLAMTIVFVGLGIIAIGAIIGLADTLINGVPK